MINKNLCIFCLQNADTREHIPAKQFFKGTLAKPLITVPSCNKCNSGFQKDEDFFRQFNAGFLMDRSVKAQELMNNEITRSIRRKPAIAYQMFSQMKLANIYTKAGIYLGKGTIFKITSEDTKRINRVVKKIIQGLFFHEFKQYIPEEWIVKIIWINPKVSKNLNLDDLAKTLKWNIIKEDTFAYGFNSVPVTHQSIWILDFFRIPLFYVLVLDKETVVKKADSNTVRTKIEHT